MTDPIATAAAPTATDHPLGDRAADSAVDGPALPSGADLALSRGTDFFNVGAQVNERERAVITQVREFCDTRVAQVATRGSLIVTQDRNIQTTERRSALSGTTTPARSPSMDPKLGEPGTSSRPP